MCDHTVTLDFSVFMAYMSLGTSSTPRACKGRHVTLVYKVTPHSIEVHHYREVHIYLQNTSGT